MRAAAIRMQQATASVSEFCADSSIFIDAAIDPNGTCLIGPEYAVLFTSLGQLEAKRTTTNPDVAGLIVHILRAAGVSSGDTIALGASGSFPALLIGTLSATEAMGVYPITIISLGASSYGATRLRIHELLLDDEVLSVPPVAVSLGGDRDVGAEFDPSVRAALLQQIRQSERRLLHVEDPRTNVDQRMALYLGPDSSRSIAAFVNIGGSEANIGTSPLVLDVKPGLNTELAIPPEQQRGVLFDMAAREIPVIHLLYLRGIAQLYDLPWDPVPLPQPGTTRLREPARSNDWRIWSLTAVYLLCLGAIALLPRTKNNPPNRT